MTRTITQIKVWTSTDKKEHRVYIDFAGEKQSGCLYLTGNRWQAKGTLEGMTAEEKKAAWSIVQERFDNDGKWHTIWSDQMNPPAPKASQPETVKSEPKIVNRIAGHCRKCGEYLPAGQGELVRLYDEEDIDFIGGGSKWIVFCLDKDGCESRHQAYQAEKKAEAEREAERQATIAQLSPEQDKANREAFWNEFFEATAYIGS